MRLPRAVPWVWKRSCAVCVIAQLLCIGRPPLGQAGKWGSGCSAVRCPMQRAASFIAACCAGTCSALHFTSRNGIGCQGAHPKANGRAAFEQNQSCPCMKERSFSGKRKCVFPQKERAGPNALPLFLIPSYRVPDYRAARFKIQNSAFLIICGYVEVIEEALCVVVHNELVGEVRLLE